MMKDSADALLNEKLQAFVKRAQEAKDTKQKHIALTRLIAAIQGSGRLNSLRSWRGVADFEDLYNEAKSKTFIEICQKIDQYKPQYSVMAWVNKTLAWRFQDSYNDSRLKGITNIPGRQKLPFIPSLEDLNEDIRANGGSTDKEMELLKSFVEDDPENLLKAEHIKHRPQATFQKILQMICQTNNWEEISTELDVSISTASNFYQRKLRKFLPYLQKSLQ